MPANDTPPHGGRIVKTPDGIAHLAPGGSVPRLLLTPQQAAEALAISTRKLWSLTASGEIPHVRIGRCVRYISTSLSAYLASQEKGGDA
jgi:excisionase family DNA binding protein